jgi:hypothetical protein
MVGVRAASNLMISSSVRVRLSLASSSNSLQELIHSFTGPSDQKVFYIIFHTQLDRGPPGSLAAPRPTWQHADQQPGSLRTCNLAETATGQWAVLPPRNTPSEKLAAAKSAHITADNPTILHRVTWQSGCPKSWPAFRGP